MEYKFSEEDYLPLSGIQHMAFCERQWALIHIERQWEENVRTMEGRILHENADDPFFQESRGNLVIARSVPLSSSELGLYGVADVVEFRKAAQNGPGIELAGYEGLWVPYPVEYKRGKPKVDDRDRVQLCAQAMCLEEMYGLPVNDGSLYYGETRRREQVLFDDKLRSQVNDLAIRMHELFLAGITPAATAAKHCSLCSLTNICIPKLVKKKKSVLQYIKGFLEQKDNNLESFSR